MQIESASAAEKAYTDRLVRKQMIWWKSLLRVQAPYGWNLRRLKPGFTLEIGCGIGRNLLHLRGRGVGIDQSVSCVEVARSRGCQAYTPADFKTSAFAQPGKFDSLLLAHVAEHMTSAEAAQLLGHYVGYLKPEGKIIVITPQERGYESDPTHREFMDWQRIRGILATIQFSPVMEYSFPFPRSFGRLFIYNEFVSVAQGIPPPR